METDDIDMKVAGYDKDGRAKKCSQWDNGHGPFGVNVTASVSGAPCVRSCATLSSSATEPAATHANKKISIIQEKN